MRFETVERRDFPEIIEIIRSEFPGSALDSPFLEKRFLEENVFLMKLCKKNRILGFADVEIFDGETARIAVLVVRKDSRDKGVGKTLLSEVTGFLKERGIERVSVLIRQGNERAKRLYSSQGFRFVALYQAKESGEAVEEMELEFGGEKPSYVS